VPSPARTGCPTRSRDTEYPSEEAHSAYGYPTPTTPARSWCNVSNDPSASAEMQAQADWRQAPPHVQLPAAPPAQRDKGTPPKPRSTCAQQPPLHPFAPNAADLIRDTRLQRPGTQAGTSPTAWRGIDAPSPPGGGRREDHQRVRVESDTRGPPRDWGEAIGMDARENDERT
jgi:hypothetical protein